MSRHLEQQCEKCGEAHHEGACLRVTHGGSFAAPSTPSSPATWTDGEVQSAVNATCSCGGRGPDDGCCQACEVWHRLHGRWPTRATCQWIDAIRALPDDETTVLVAMSDVNGSAIESCSPLRVQVRKLEMTLLHGGISEICGAIDSVDAALADLRATIMHNHEYD